MEKVSKRANAILEVKESVTLLSQLLQGYSKDTCSQSHQELIKVSTAQHIQTSCRKRVKKSSSRVMRMCVSRIFTSAVKR